MISGYIKNILRKTGLMYVVNSLNNLRLYFVKIYCNLTGKDPLEAIYNDAFFSTSHQDDILKDTPKILVEILNNWYRPQGVVDFGCGRGLYLKEFQKLGIEILGMDGSVA